MRTTVLVSTLILSLVAACLLSPRPIPAETAGAAHAEPLLRIPFDGSNELIVVPVSVNGSRDLRCILDTGMPEGLFLLDPAVGKELGLEYVTSVAVSGTGSETNMAGMAMGATLSLGTVEVADQRVIVLEEVSEVANMGIDGVIGGSFFLEYVIEVDHDAGQVTLFESESYILPPGAEVLALTLAGTRPYVEVAVAIDGEEEHPLTLFVDSGANSGLFLNTPGIDGLATPQGGIPGLVVTGVGGDVQGVVGRVTRFRLGTRTWSDVLCRFPDVADGQDKGTLGLGLLRDYRVTFDYPGARLILGPATRESEAEELNMAGLALRPLPLGRYQVRGIFAGSPGAEAGVREGDILVAIDGTEVSELGMIDTRRRLTRAGETVTLTLERDEQRLELKVRLRRLI